MTTAKQGASGGGMLSKLVVVLLLAVTIGLYLRIVMVEGPATQGQAAPQASVQVTEGYATSPQANAVVLQDLPEDQMQLIIQVFAPELQQN